MRSDYPDILRSRISAILREESSGPDIASTYLACAQASWEVMEEIRATLHNGVFADKEDEIDFYKESVPVIWGQFFFYKRLVRIEAWRKFQPAETFRDLLNKQLARAELFPQRRRQICEYYYEGRTDADERLFLRPSLAVAALQPMGMYLDKGLTPGAYLLSRMRGYELLRTWLTDELRKLAYLGGEAVVPKRPEYHGRPVELVELFKALHLTGFFGDGSFKDLMLWAGAVLGVEIGQFDGTLQQIKDRKITKTAFLDKMKKALEEYIDKRL